MIINPDIVSRSKRLATHQKDSYKFYDMSVRERMKYAALEEAEKVFKEEVARLRAANKKK